MMYKKKLGFICVSLVAVLLTLNILPRMSADALYNEKVDGIVFWGTSGLSRVYNDMQGETYNSTGTRQGSSELDQHNWTSFNHSSFDYKDTGSSSNLGDYSVESEYIKLSSPSKQSVSLSGNNLHGGDSATSVAKSINDMFESGWEPKKTMIALWAGEDWITAGADASLDRPSTAEELQEFMGLDVEELGDDTTIYDENGDEITFEGTPGKHTLVWDNSYYAYDEGEYPVYTYEEDGIDLTLERQLSQLTDPYNSENGDDLDLPSTAGVTFGRIISGYDYQYEVAEQDFSKIPHGGESNTVSTTVELEDGTSTSSVEFAEGAGPEYQDAEDLTAYIPTYHEKTEDKDAYYSWSSVSVSNNLRSDSGPRAGYCDAYEWVTIGGLDGKNSDQTDGDWTVDDSADGADDHDGVQVKVWHTTDKPIYKIVVKTGHVMGYNEYWSKKYSDSNNYGDGAGAPKVYVFGLGPYNKTEYTEKMGKTINDIADIDGEDVEMTKRIDKARQSFNSSLKSNLKGGTFIDIWDITLENNPYYRWGSVVDAKAGGIEDGGALHGKWYDKNTNNWLFHLFWSTILKDNPNDELPESVDISLYSASCALTAYANNVLSNGKTGGGGDSGGEAEADTEDTNVAEHTIKDIAAMGMAGEGAALGYGDEEYDFHPFITTTFSDSSSYTEYSALLGMNEDDAGGQGMYQYARYGSLLSQLGIDKTGTQEVMSPRFVPGAILSLLYMGNSAVSMLWNVAIKLIKMFNPFQVFADASSIAATAKANMDADASTSNGILVKLAQTNNGFRNVLEEIGKIYDTLTGTFEVSDVNPVTPFSDAAVSGGTPVHTTQTWTITGLYFIFFIIGLVFCYKSWMKTGKLKSKVLALLIRMAFIAIGVTFLGTTYTAVLNGVADNIDVVASPSSQIMAATFVDYADWVKTARLAPPEGAVLESEDSEENAGGQPSSEALNKIRQTAWSINKSTGIFGDDFNMNSFSEALSNDDGNFTAWNDMQYTQFRSDEPLSDGFKAIESVTNLLKDWTLGEFYYATDFGSESFADFSNRYAANVGYHEAPKDEDTVVATPEPTEDDEDAVQPNENTLQQMFGEINTTEAWMGRSVDDNTDILTNQGEYGEESTSGSDWHLFNIFANGNMTAEEDGGIIKYSSDSAADGSGELTGLKLDENIGLSTLSMYNYLTTDFRTTGLTTYSTAKSMNGYSEKAHYKVNMIGSGILSIVFYFNCLAFLLAIVVVSLYYSIGMALKIIKRGFSLIVQIPFALVGMLRGIAQVIMTFVSIIAELLGSIFVYSLLSELLLIIVTMFEGPLQEALSSIEATGIVAMIGGYVPSGSALYPVLIVGTTLLLGFISVFMIKHGKAFMRVFEKALDLVMLKVILTKEQAAVYDKHCKELKTSGKRVPGSNREAVCNGSVIKI